eukprot:9608969-Prorocentrum_lima.AAC.1
MVSKVRGHRPGQVQLPRDIQRQKKTKDHRNQQKAPWNDGSSAGSPGSRMAVGNTPKSKGQ